MKVHRYMIKVNIFIDEIGNFIIYSKKMETQNNYETNITKLTINEKIIYIKITWEKSVNSLFTIQLFFENNSWQGKYTSEAAKKYVQRFKQTEEEYVIDVKSCFVKMNPMFKYEFIVNDESKGTFSWKKKFDGSAVILHGSLEVHKSTDNYLILIDSLIQENLSMRDNLQICKREIKQYDCDLKRYKDEIEKLNNINSSLEDTLLSKFVHLLNSKKRRIQVLEDAVNNINDS